MTQSRTVTFTNVQDKVERTVEFPSYQSAYQFVTTLHIAGVDAVINLLPEDIAAWYTLLLSHEYKLGTHSSQHFSSLLCPRPWCSLCWLKVTLALRFFRFLILSPRTISSRLLITNQPQMWSSSDSNCVCPGWHWGTHMLDFMRVVFGSVFVRVVYIVAARRVYKIDNYLNLHCMSFSR